MKKLTATEQNFSNDFDERPSTSAKYNSVIPKLNRFGKMGKFHKIGVPLEMASSKALKILKIKHSHNHFDSRYVEDTGGTDLQTRKEEFECKNLSGKYPLRYSWLKEEVLDRFSNRKKKFLILSINNLSKAKKRFLREHKVKVVSLGFQVSFRNFRSAVKILTDRLIPLLCRHKNVLCNVGLSNAKLVTVTEYSRLVGCSYKISANQRFLVDFKGFCVV